MNADIAYQKMLAYLQNLVDYSLKPATNLAKTEFSLAAVTKFLEFTGSPQQAYPIIHIAGTKGKGSIAALISSALQAQGYRVGLFTSPALFDFNEQIRVNFEPITHAELVELVEHTRPNIEAVLGLSTFEATVGLGLLHFQRQRVDVAVVEAGLGGEKDATNVVTPLVSVISSISYDHTHILGNTLAEIAAHKAGIIKPRRPVVTALQTDEALQIIRQKARAQDSHLVEVGRDVHFAWHGGTLAGQDITLWMEGDAPLDIRLSLLGKHQVENAASAYAALCIIARENGLTITDKAIQQGFANAVWPGRFEVIQNKPTIILDGAHNRDSAKRLAETVKEYFPGNPVCLVLGTSEDKDFAGILAELKPLGGQLITTQASHPRAMDCQHLAEVAASIGFDALPILQIDKALEKALKLSDPETGLVLVTGSLFVVGEARKWLGKT
jgi:dihydrofolate synthase / folylpolyglutamate synthase